MKNETLLVNRSDFTDLTIGRVEMGKLEPGQIRVSIGPWALTANNITYMVTGDMIGYWKYFDPQAYGLSTEGASGNLMGRMPVWGYAEVTQSACEGVDLGAQIYGYFPIAKYIDLKPGKLSPSGFSDAAEHRLPLHGIYNRYSFKDADPSFDSYQDLQPILRPLFTTSFLIDDFFEANRDFGAEQIIVLSASSKTALGTAFCLKQRGGVKVLGLTSSGNSAFVNSTGFYDDVVSYDDITDLNPDVKTAFIDMAGNGAVMETLYGHFEENIVYNCMVGKSHWQGEGPPKPKLGAPAKMFFAPDQAKQRIAQWGADGFNRKLAERWLPFCAQASDWLSVAKSDDIGDVLALYKDLLSGEADPARTTLFKI